MADTAKNAAQAGADTAGSAREDGGPNAAVERLLKELEGYLAAQAQRALVGLGSGLGSATAKLTDAADGQGLGLGRLAVEGGRKALGSKAAGGKDALRGAMTAGLGMMKDNLAGALRNAAGKRRKGKAGARPTVILESADIGVPVREAYDQWTQFEEFSGFAKAVRGVSTADETTTDWKFKIFWSSRSWRARVTEQVPDRRIAWTAEGAKGTATGVVTFHPLGDSLTRVLLLIEYHPQGLFEKTGNLWRAQGRRARLDLKHFARFVTVRGEATGGWRGEIRDGEVVVGHEDAVAEEEGLEDAAGDEAEEAYEDGDEVDGETGAYDEEAGEQEPEEDEDEARDLEEEDAPEPEDAPGAQDGEGEYEDAEDAEDAEDVGEYEYEDEEPR